MSNLFFSIQQANKIEEMIIKAEGEITPEVQALLRLSSSDIAHKIDGLDVFLQKLKNGAEIYRSQAQFFQKAAQNIEKASELIKEDIKKAMLDSDVKALNGHQKCLKITKARQIVKINDMQKLSGYQKAEVTYTIDKDSLFEDLKIGPVDGAELQDVYALRFYTAKHEE